MGPTASKKDLTLSSEPRQTWRRESPPGRCSRLRHQYSWLRLRSFSPSLQQTPPSRTALAASYAVPRSRPPSSTRCEASAYSGDWFLVSSGQASLDGNDGTETPGLCVPGRLAAWSSINSTEQESEIHTFHTDNDNCHQKLVQHRKTHGSWMRLQKMTRCVSLVTQHERSRHLQYAFLFLTRPDLYLCSVSRFDLTALPEQKIMFLGQGWGVEHNGWMMEWWTLCATTYCCEARHSTLAGAAPHV